jgi:uncharacterized membrane protein (DUF373 family)
MSQTDLAQKSAPRSWIARIFRLVEDFVYIALGVLLTILIAILLIGSFRQLWQSHFSGPPGQAIVPIMDRALLILLIVELLYTVQVSFREHALLPEPFLLIGLISAVRRILVITAEFSGPSAAATPDITRWAMIELSILTILIVALVGSLVLLRKFNVKIEAHRG